MMENILQVDLPEIRRVDYLYRRVLLALSQSKVFCVANTTFKLSHTTMVKQAVRIQIRVRGHVLELFVSKTMVNALLAPFHLQIDNMSADALALFVIAKGRLGDIQIEAITPLENDHVSPHALCAKEVQSGQEFGWEMAVVAPPEFPLHTLMSSLETFVCGEIPPPLTQWPVTVPLVACTLRMTSDELADIELGDVLFLEGS